MEIVTWPDERLRRIAAPVEVFDDRLRAFVEALETVMRAGPAAVGIAAPQVGRSERIVIVDASSRDCRNHGRLVLVNPEIVDWEGSVVGREGCLSVPELTGNVVRAERVVVEALDPDGHEIRFETEGFEARVVQHEIDHLEGRLFLDRIVSRRRDLFRRRSSGGRR